MGFFKKDKKREMSKNHDVKGRQYKKELSSSYHLVIQVRTMSVGYAVLDPMLNTYVAYGVLSMRNEDANYALQEEYILKQDILGLPYRQVTVVVDSPMRTVVPRPYFDSQRAQELLRFVGHDVHPEDVVLNDDVMLANSVVVYAMPKFLYFFLKSQFQNLTIRHALTSEIGAMLLKHNSGDLDAKLRVRVGRKYMDVILVKNNKLQLVNRFNIPSINDFVYNIVNVFTQTGIKEKEVRVEVGGAISSVEDPQIELLRRFVSHVYVDAIPQYYNYDFPHPEQEYRYSTIFRIPTCE
ncbi:MAG: DUF3822 family protein [Bacteroidia bacterium]|nr:DUF3822 family protein [Bacteroidia bacterium]